MLFRSQSEEFTAAATGAVLLLVLILTFIVARSLVDPLRRLQAEALEIAAVQLPARVAALGEATDPTASLDVEPVGVHSTDEIGKVARAFDQVHKEAVRLAGNEALLRGSLSAMFISLSRRSVPLIERLTRMIDSMEQNEGDPDRLSSLFSMDHLVTRMRRNSENLLVLAGQEPVRRWSQPVPLADVARAAMSEIEQYTRVVLDIQHEAVVSGQVVADVVHLLAEIIENATMFSPRDTLVHMSGHELDSGGVLLKVRDNGVGISPARLAEMNHRLDTPPKIDVSVHVHMGLFAVSRLAARHGIKVRLRAVSPQGLSVLVWLPGTLTDREAARHAAPWPRQPASQAAAAQPTVRGRHIPGRHRLKLSAAAGLQDDTGYGYADSALVTGIAPAVAPAAGKSEWFRAKRPSSASAQADTHEVIDFATSTGTGLPSTELASAPVPGGHTAAGLPSRVPGAHLFSGSAANMTAETWGTGDTSAASPRQPGRGTEEAAQARSASLPRRSPQQARNRLSGFQLGSRQVEEPTSSEGGGLGVERTLPPGPELASHRIHHASRGRRARDRGIRGRDAAGAVGGHPRLGRRAVRGHHLRADQPHGMRGARLRWRGGHASTGRDGRRADVRQGDQRRGEPGRPRSARMRYPPGLVRNDAAGGGGRRAADPGGPR